jgi:hypothetical protein
MLLEQKKIDQGPPNRCTTAQFRGSEHPAAHPSSRADRFLCRIDAHLPILPDDRARRVFLDRQIEGWQARYARFLATEGASEPAANCADPPHAADFLLTITALAARRGAFAGNRGEPHMSGPHQRPRIERAMLSLLVAADQRCPAIIGGAHRLYYGRADRSCLDAGDALAQLRNDAHGLLAAISDAEAEMKASEI